MIVISQDGKLVADYERHIWQADGKCIYLISIDNQYDNYLRFAMFKTEEEAVKQLRFMVEGALKGYGTFEFK